LPWSDSVVLKYCWSLCDESDMTTNHVAVVRLPIFLLQRVSAVCTSSLAIFDECDVAAVAAAPYASAFGCCKNLGNAGNWKQRWLDRCAFLQMRVNCYKKIMIFRGWRWRWRRNSGTPRK
jgi:hypothetical protein